MKTPREILFARHANAEPKLDAIRERMLLEQLSVKSRAAESPTLWRKFNPLFVVTKLWQELVWPCRRIWAGIAAVWVGILIFGMASSDWGPAVATSAPAPDVMMAIEQQRQMMAQLLDSAPAESATKPRLPGPRSEERQTIAAV